MNCSAWARALLLGPDAAIAGFADSPLTARAISAATGAVSNTAGYGASCLVASDCSASGFGEAAATGALFGAAFGADTSCGGQSFTADTRVVLAGGSTAPISSLKPGDKVLATDAKTGKTQPETVTAVEVNHDTDLYDLTITTSDGTEVIHTTAAHLFWDPAKKKWVQAAKLKKGEHLKTADGQDAVAVGGSAPATHDGWMWDLTVPGNGDHDFYVVAGSTPVLVHNTDGKCTIPSAARRTRIKSPIEVLTSAWRYLRLAYLITTRVTSMRPRGIRMQTAMFKP